MSLLNPGKVSASCGRSTHGSWVLLLGLGVLGSGCAVPIAYRPNLTAVDELGLPEVKQRLSETLGRSVAPPIGSVEVTSHALTYRWHQTLHGPYGIPMGSVPHDTQIHFANVINVQIYTNHWVFIWGHPQRILAKVLFASGEDARTFADLVLSMREHRLACEGGLRPPLPRSRAPWPEGRALSQEGSSEAAEE